MRQLLGKALSRRPPPVWEGVYGDARDVPVEGAGWSASVWVPQLERQLDDVLAAKASWGRVPREMVDADVLGTLIATMGERVRVLDFGGGLGAWYVAVQAGLGSGVKLEFVVAETREVVDAGRRRHAGDDRIVFRVGLPEKEEKFDIVHARSALQYVEDWEGCLSSFTAYEPRFIVLPSLMAGPQPTFASAQLNVPGSKFAYWFLNEGQVVGAMQRHGYSLAYASLGPEEKRLDSLPAGYRIGRPRNLVFQRSR